MTMTITINEDGIDRPATEAEIAQLEKDAQVEAELNAKRQAEAEAKAAQRQTLLARLGITEEEARILLGGN